MTEAPVLTTASRSSKWVTGLLIGVLLVNLQLLGMGIERIFRPKSLSLDVDENQVTIINDREGRPKRIISAHPPTPFWSDAEGMPFASFYACYNIVLAAVALVLHWRRK